MEFLIRIFEFISSSSSPWGVIFAGMMAISLCFASLAILNEALKQFRATIQEEAIVEMAKRECLLQNQSNSEEDEPESNVIEDTNEFDNDDEHLRILSSSSSSAYPHRNQLNLTKLKIMDGILFCSQMILSYLVMLAVMSYSIWIFIAVILGQAIGSWLFFAKPTVLLHQHGPSSKDQAESPSRHTEADEEHLECRLEEPASLFTADVILADVHCPSISPT